MRHSLIASYAVMQNSPSMAFRQFAIVCELSFIIYYSFAPNHQLDGSVHKIIICIASAFEKRVRLILKLVPVAWNWIYELIPILIFIHYLIVEFISNKTMNLNLLTFLKQRMMTVNKYQIMSLISLIEVDHFVSHKMIQWVPVDRSNCQFFTIFHVERETGIYRWLLFIIHWLKATMYGVYDHHWSVTTGFHSHCKFLTFVVVVDRIFLFVRYVICNNNRCVYNCVHNKQ